MSQGARLLRDVSFNRQLSAVVAVAVLSLAFVSSLATSWQGSRQIRAGLLEQGRKIAENLASQSKLALLYDAADNANEAANVTLSFPGVTSLEIRRADGRLLLGRGLNGVSEPARTEPSVLPRQQAYFEAEAEDSWRFVAPVLAGNAADSPFEVSERHPQTLGYVRVVQSKATLERMRAEVFAINFAVSFLFAFVFLLILRRLTARLTQPLERLSSAMARAEAGVAEVRAEPSGPKDIADMALAFNRMMAVLEERQRELRLLLDNLPAAVLVHGPDAAISYANPVAMALFGLSPARIREGATFDASWHFVRTDGAAMAPEEYPANRVIADKQPLHDYTVGISRGKGDMPRWVSVSALPETDEKGVLQQVIVCFVDITERKQFEEELRCLNESLEQRVREELTKNREKDALLIQQSRLATMGEMMHNVAHQWRQPLAVMALVLQNIKDEYEFGELSQESLDKNVTQGMRMAQKMSSTIDDFRNFFRPDQAVSRFSLRESVREALNLVEATFRSNQIEVEVEDGEDVVVEGFANEYSQVLLNVLTNAKDAIGNKKAAGKISVAVSRVDGMGVVKIRDNGGGIPEDILPKIFDPYFTTKESGTGIGLYMSRMIMGHMRGHISAHSMDGGTEMVVSVPAAS